MENDRAAGSRRQRIVRTRRFRSRWPRSRKTSRRPSLGNPRFEEVDDLYWRPVQVQLEVLLPEPTQCTPLAIRDDNVDLNQVDIDAVDEGLAGLLSIRSSRREDGKKVEHRHKERNAPGCKRAPAGSWVQHGTDLAFRTRDARHNREDVSLTRTIALQSQTGPEPVFRNQSRSLAHPSMQKMYSHTSTRTLHSPTRQARNSPRQSRVHSTHSSDVEAAARLCKTPHPEDRRS